MYISIFLCIDPDVSFGLISIAEVLLRRKAFSTHSEFLNVIFTYWSNVEILTKGEKGPLFLDTIILRISSVKTGCPKIAKLSTWVFMSFTSLVFGKMHWKKIVGKKFEKNFFLNFYRQNVDENLMPSYKNGFGHVRVVNPIPGPLYGFIQNPYSDRLTQRGDSTGNHFANIRFGVQVLFGQNGAIELVRQLEIAPTAQSRDRTGLQQVQSVFGESPFQVPLVGENFFEPKRDPAES